MAAALDTEATRGLLRWYRRTRRPLPWRQTRDPYAIWVAETMLQQTRSETVAPYYLRFLERFPTVPALASARESAVLALWSGLGYYRRARNLRRAAREIVERYGAVVPDDPSLLRTLPGIGRYTAGAVSSIAFDRPEPVLDGNVARVLTRLFAIEGRWRSGPLEKRLWDVASALMPRKHPGAWNQALMELGATVCAPRSPQCSHCPLEGACAAARDGSTGRFPERAPRPSTRLVRRAYVILERRGRVLLVQHRRGDLLRGLWEFPNESIVRGDTPLRVASCLAAAMGASEPAIWGRPIVHTIMSERIESSVFRAALERTTAPVRRGARWYRWSEVRHLPLSTVGIQILQRRAASASID